VWQWLGIVVRGVFYAVSVVVMFPALVVFRADQRAPTIDDGLDLGYDDNDPGKDVDE
jgi:hypothetical protein